MGAGHAHALYVHEHSPVHRMAPEAKLLAALGLVLAVAVTPREAWWAFVADGIALAAVARLARIPGRFILARLVVVAPFVLFAALIPFVAGGETVEWWGIELSRPGLWATWNILAKAGLGATVSILLAATTEVPEILRGLTVLRVPPVLTSIAAFMMRYLELIADELGRMRVAMASRGFRPRWIWEARPAAAAVGALFIRSYERGERVHAAMLARGYTGTMPDLRGERATAGDWQRAAALVAVAVLVAITALVVV